MNASGAAARLVRNTVANGVGSVIGVVIGLVITPFLIGRLGLAAFGVWALALTLSFSGGYAALSELESKAPPCGTWPSITRIPIYRG